MSTANCSSQGNICLFYNTFGFTKRCPFVRSYCLDQSPASHCGRISSNIAANGALGSTQLLCEQNARNSAMACSIHHRRIIWSLRPALGKQWVYIASFATNTTQQERTINKLMNEEKKCMANTNQHSVHGSIYNIGVIFYSCVKYKVTHYAAVSVHRSNRSAKSIRLYSVLFLALSCINRTSSDDVRYVRGKGRGLDTW